MYHSEQSKPGRYFISSQTIRLGRGIAVELFQQLQYLLVAPVDRAIARTELSHMSGMVIEDGKYKLRFSFNGAVQQHSVRVADGTLLAG